MRGICNITRANNNKELDYEYMKLSVQIIKKSKGVEKIKYSNTTKHIEIHVAPKSLKSSIWGGGTTFWNKF